ncbi:paladin-like [Lytechinus variegatus]|uniref:paladin-like n=1 Tax=Lytechinus variegatus TaxID=7654 RepID=UPI001BB2C5D4|nr:paladin-like [Lytechinus variegatus]XP_041485536.1 paladin-like [Lytechinus variegatus]XP_041485537.1 paladin-like [Lytechinus variegatus]
MGTGASSASSRSPSPEYAQNQRNSMRQHLDTEEDRKNSLNVTVDREKWKGQNVICNDVAPIVISKDCFEEYQCLFLAEKQMSVVGAIKKGMPEHNLIQEKYFMVADHFKDMDELNTTAKYGAPNFRKAHGGYPVYGMGQPSSDGLRRVMEYLEHEKYSDILLINIRHEPVVFLKRGKDYVSFTPRERENLTRNITTCTDVDDVVAQEAAIRKEIVKFALVNKDNKFAFYNDIEDLSDEPHFHQLKYIEDIKTTSEVYSLHSVGFRNAFFTRIPMSSSKASINEPIDQLLNAVKEVPSLFSSEESLLPILVFTGHMGSGRTTFAMCLGILIVAHQRGFPAHVYDPYTSTEESPKVALGEFWAIMKVCSLLPDGMKRKREVDSILDVCTDMGNIREKIVECHHKLQEIQEDYQIAGQSAREYYLESALTYLERYCYLIIFNSYLHEQFQQCFCKSFTSWMRQRPELHTALAHINSTERTAPPELITKGLRFLVADDYVGLDVLSSQREVGTSNFRKVPGLPVYGMAQPSSKGLDRVCQYLLSKKHGHSSIHSFNLRGEMIIQCDTTTYTPRELASLDKNISIAGFTERDVEKKEIQLKNEILRSKRTIQVYTDIAEPKKNLQFESVTTLHEMYDDQIKETPQLHYYRIVGGFQRSGPLEKTMNRIVSVVKDLDDIFTDEDGPALLFNCQTGKEQTTVAMAIAGLIIWHKKGFPVGTKLGEQERISVPQAEYTKGEFSAVRKLVMRLPHGTQVKREVDLMLDKCSETMTPMHFHLREVIFSMFNKLKTAKGEEVDSLHQQSLDNLERYIYLILFNSYLHMHRSTNWEMPFQYWMKTVGYKVGAYDILDQLSFGELDIESRFGSSSMRDRWCREINPKSIVRGYIV